MPFESDPSATDGGARLSGLVAGVDYVGSTTTYRVDTSVGSMSVEEPNDTLAPDYEVGRRVLVTWAPDAAFVLPERAG